MIFGEEVKSESLKRRKQKKESHRTMKLFSRRTDNGFHNSWQVAKCPTNLVHGIAGTRFTINGQLMVQDSWLKINELLDGREEKLF